MSSITTLSTDGLRREGSLLPGGHEIRGVRRGGMGVVYLVHNREVQLPFAIKTFQDQFLMSYEAQQRFKREVRSWLRLGSHQHIVQALFVDIIDCKPHLFLEYVDGRTLLEHMLSAPLPLAEILDFAIQICNGMNYVHSAHGLIHRDLKPSNIMVTVEGCVKITDFGIVKALGVDDGAAGTPEDTQAGIGGSVVTQGSIGTPEYMAPEQWEAGGTVDKRTDIYAFGVVLYEMVCGRPPFPRKPGHPVFIVQTRHLREPPPDPACFAPHISPRLKSIILRCLEKSPEKRFGNFEELGHQLGITHHEDIGISWSPRDFTGPPLVRCSQAYQMAVRAASLQYVDDFDDACALLDEALMLEPEQVFALRLRAQNACAVGRFSEALVYLTKLERLAPTDVGVHNDMAFALNEVKQHSAAKQHAEQAIALDPCNASAWNNRGIAAFSLSLFDEARQSFTQALHFNPRYAEVWNNQGFFLLKMGQPSQAEDCFRRAISLNPRYLMPYFNLNQLLLEREDVDGALSLMEQVLNVDPHHETALRIHAALRQIRANP